MTPIDVARPVTASATRATAPRQVGGAFRVPEDAADAAEQAGAIGEATPVMLGVMLAAEALERDTVRDQAARRHGHIMLAGLTALQRALLEMDDDKVALERLEGLLGDMPKAADPRLAALLAAIVLRVRVELARMGR
jgi:hypothetical protein